MIEQQKYREKFMYRKGQVNIAKKMKKGYKKVTSTGGYLKKKKIKKE